jgi:lipopolysaccharide transport system permease protein
MSTLVSPSVAATRIPSDHPKQSTEQPARSRKPFRYYFDLILHLVQRDFILRYKGSALGVLWVVLIPLTHLALLVFTFDKVVPLNIDSYPAFVFTALLPWTWFSNSISTSGGLFINNRDLVRRSNFPPLILIIVNTLTNLLLFFVVLPVVFIILFWHGRSLTPYLLYLPVLALIQSILIIGLSLMIASWNVFYRDVQQILGVILMLAFYITPVFYKTDAAAEKYRFLFDINPISVLIQGFRDILFYTRSPQWHLIAFSAVVSLIIGAIGYYVYSRQISNVIDAL